MNTEAIKIVVIGGGTGSISILTGLKDRTDHLSVIVNMADDGGSTGVLRDELGVLPAGDAWKCIAALSDSQQLRDLFKYRFNEGTFKGHTMGNILMAAAEKTAGDFEGAVKLASEMLHIHGVVIPATLDNARLKMEWPGTDYVLYGEHVIDVEQFSQDPRQAKLSLSPIVHANPTAVAAIREADMVIIAPGDIYTSLGPQLVIDDIARALRETSALKLYVANLVTKQGHTDTFTVADHVDELERFVGAEFLDVVLYNQQMPNEQSLQQGIKIVPAHPEQLETKHYQTMAGNFLGATVGQDAAETFSVATRSPIRHDPTAIANAIMNLYDTKRL